MSAVAEVEVEIASVSATLNLVDEQNPWLGLDSFNEETRQYFYGREEEVAELARRVQRKTLSILFGQSGLGKTSILRAGIVPRLRREGFCPVYVRIDYAPESPAPSQQIKQAIFRATEGAGKWTRPGSAVPGESLWEFLHHRDDLLMDPTGHAITPLLIFDQFEEIFTLAQDDDFGRRRVAEFVEDLADLVENRPPKALEVMLENEESIVERFDFNRADYRILIALREDYLAHLEGLKASMPSITQNRMRLARMTGEQALTAVLKPGGKLVNQEVAESIVRFVAGGSELRNAEVEPSLLSLVCRELNNTRIAQKRGEISADLLAGSRETILHEFYERALADQPPGVRRFIEDEMLTESGFRESLAEERVLRAFDHARAEPGALALLVNRRLLRIEERLDLRRVELTHDVLCDVVVESRDQRHEREAREDAERQLEAQRAREAATHRALIRARKIAAGCAALALVAIAGAIFGYAGMKQAQQARVMAEGARGEAEKLILYLLDDFYLELEPVGRIDVAADLAKRALSYYAALPPELKTAATERNRALAMVRYGYILRNSAQQAEAVAALGEATRLLRELRNQGDLSEVTAIGLALGLGAQARVQALQGLFPAAAEIGKEGSLVLRDRVSVPAPSIPLLRAHGMVTNVLGWTLLRNGSDQDAIEALESAREAYRKVDGLQYRDLASAAGFAEASAWQAEALMARGKLDDAQRIAMEAARVGEGVLNRVPGHLQALRAHSLAMDKLSDLEVERMHLEKAAQFAEQSARDLEALAKIDPANKVTWNNLVGLYTGLGRNFVARGRAREGIAFFQRALEIERRTDITSFADTMMLPAIFLSLIEADLGTTSDLASNPRHRRFTKIVQTQANEFRRGMNQGYSEWIELTTASLLGANERARELGPAVVRRFEALKPVTETGARFRRIALGWTHHYLGLASFAAGDDTDAERHAKQAVDYFTQVKARVLEDRTTLSEARIQLALVLARRGRQADALSLVEPELKFQRELVDKGSDDLEQRLQLARARYVSALAAPAAAASQLAQAAAIIDRFPVEMKRRGSVKRLQDAIVGEMAKKS